MQNGEILVCTGTGFADSLSASAVGKPILLVGNALTKEQKSLLAGSSGRFVIIGGVNSVSADVEAELREYGAVERLSGNSRHETSVLVAERFFNSPQKAAVAYSMDFPDGLCGGPLAYSMGAPLLLTRAGAESIAASYTEKNGIHGGFVLGGKGLVSDQSAQIIFGEEVHTHSYTSEVTEPACTEDGYTTYVCSCGDSYIESIPATGHDWGEWTRTKEPTTSETGVDTRTCSVCKATETRTVDKLPAEEENPGSNTIDTSESYAVPEVVDIINQYRAEEGLPALSYYSAGQEAANIRAAELNISFSHTRPDGSDYSDLTGSYNLWGECIASGYGGRAQAVVDAWMASEVHRNTLMATFFSYAVVARNGANWVILLG